jgi:hypothetical protein
VAKSRSKSASRSTKASGKAATLLPVPFRARSRTHPGETLFELSAIIPGDGRQLRRCSPSALGDV